MSKMMRATLNQGVWTSHYFWIQVESSIPTSEVSAELTIYNFINLN